VVCNIFLTKKCSGRAKAPLILALYFKRKLQMSIFTKAKTLSAVALKPSIIIGQSKYLFILSHMRSRSSLLSHILGSNDCVCGYSELHRFYLRYRDIIKMRLELYDDLKCDLRGKYLLDKLLHNKRDISKEVLEAVNPKFIFLLREPESTIKSTMQMGHITGNDSYKNPEKVSEYYCSRLSRLKEFAETIGGDYFFLESDDLVNNTEYILGELTGWLGLDTPLVENYLMFNNTGKPGYGDPSDNIRAGKIIKTKGHSDIEIPQEILQISEYYYEKCRASLMSHVA